MLKPLDIKLEFEIGASPSAVWAALVNDMEAWFLSPGGGTMGLELEPRVGGRWFRDTSAEFGPGAGHLWGHVQVFKPGVLLELVGPGWMSEPNVHHVAFRLEPSGTGTRLTLTNRTAQPVADEVLGAAADTWTLIIEKGLITHVAHCPVG